MLSPKMQRSIRVNDSQLMMLSERARFDCTRAGYLHKRTADSNKWQLRWFVLYQNLLFYYDSESCNRPSGVVFLEGCYCERIITTTGCSKKDLHDKQVIVAFESLCFAVLYRRENQRQYEFRASNEVDCQNWVEVISEASFNKLLLQKEELEQKHLHLLQIVESEKTAKWQYTKQCEELTGEIKKLRCELHSIKKEWRPTLTSTVPSAIINPEASSIASSSPPPSTGGSGVTTSASMATTATTALPASSAMASSSTSDDQTAVGDGESWTGSAAGSVSGGTFESGIGFHQGSGKAIGGVDGSLSYADSSLTTVVDMVQLQKIKKVQSFFRGWLCRRRWKQIVEQYIKSPHAESMRKRNCLVFRMVEEEEEYLKQLDIIVSCFVRPLRMAACSQKPPCSHEDINSIFLNVETILFLHQIFYKGLSSRMESWPTLVLGDLFNLLIPMLSIYQEYVRNHHYSVQVLTECKQSAAFSTMLDKLENKPACQSCQLDTFLMTPMHQIPRYIVTIHEILAHTPHDHVDRKKLTEACQKLEDLSRQIKDEVSETENLRKNLSIERMIVSGCDILLDVNQVYVREGRLVHNFPDKPIAQRSRWSTSKTPEQIAIRYCYLFSNHLILTTRDSNGRLHLVQDIGKIPLVNTKLIEDPYETSSDDDGTESTCTHKEQAGGGRKASSGSNMCEPQTLQSLISCPQNHDFKLVIEKKVGPPEVVHLYALTMQEKAAWISDISQCLDNVRFCDFVQNVPPSDASLVTMPQSVRNDPKLFQDDVDIRFCRSLNSCKVPRVRYATPERLLERLTDLRFLSVDFLNTFLLMYKVFTDGVTVLEALKKVYYDAEPPEVSSAYSGAVSISDPTSMLTSASKMTLSDQELLERSTGKRSFMSPRPSASSASGSEITERERDRERSASYDLQTYKPSWRFGGSFKKSERDIHEEVEQSRRRSRAFSKCIDRSAIVQSENTASGIAANESLSGESKRRVSIRVEEEPASVGVASSKGGTTNAASLAIPPSTLGKSSSNETLKATSASSSLGNLSSTTVVPSDGGTSERVAIEGPTTTGTRDNVAHREMSPEHRAAIADSESDKLSGEYPASVSASSSPSSSPRSFVSKMVSRSRRPRGGRVRQNSDSTSIGLTKTTASASGTSAGDGGGVDESAAAIEPWRSIVTSESQDDVWTGDEYNLDGSGDFSNAASSTKQSFSTQPALFQTFLRFHRKSHCGAIGVDRSTADSSQNASQRSSVQHEKSRKPSSKAGVVITSSRQSVRRSSTAAAATAFAIATSGSGNPRDIEVSPQREDGTCATAAQDSSSRVSSFRDKFRRKDSILSTAATMRVLNVLMHWVSKHSQDFDEDDQLKNMTVEFLNEIISAPNLLQAEQKVANQLLTLLSETKDKKEEQISELNALFSSPKNKSTQGIEKFSALAIAEEMTYIDHKIFVSIRSQEFLGQAWMKEEKMRRAPNIILMTKRFNEGSQLVASEIIRRTNMSARVSAIEKWTAVADIARCLRNYNGVLQICAAFTTSSVFRLKKTWEKVSKSTKQTIKKLQMMVSSDGRFRNLRDTLRRSEPPCIPYLGMYLSDLSFIEEGTPNFTEDGLLNFSKMRMIAHVIREVKRYQDTRYSIEHNPKVSGYLLNNALLFDDEELYRRSMELEPRTSRLSITPLTNLPQFPATVTTTASSSSTSTNNQ